MALLRETVLENPYIPFAPTECQARFLMDMGPEAFYGGAAGGGKSYALLMAALQFVDFPTYNALLLRRTYADLAKVGALMDVGRFWLSGTPARWDGVEHKWIFPSGATLSFGYLDTDADRLKYRGAQYAFVGFDETTLFSEAQYTYLFSRIRKLASDPFPTRMRGASNPGGIGHQWVKDRFLIRKEAPFYPARLRDNPHLDVQNYMKSLENLTPVERAQLLSGDWEAHEGGRFEKGWFRDYTRKGDVFYFPEDRAVHFRDLGCFITVDPAATPEDTTRKVGDHDYTVIGVYARPPGPEPSCAVLDIIRERLPLDQIVPRIAQVCQRWDPLYVGIEALAFQAFLLYEAKKRSDLPEVKALDPRAGKKVPNVRLKLSRATPAIIMASKGNIYLPESAPWRETFLDEVCAFTGDDKLDAHDDIVDSLAYAVLELGRGGFVPGRSLDPVKSRNLDPRGLRGDESQAHRRNLFGVANVSGVQRTAVS